MRVLLLAAALAAPSADRKDILVADFEGADYGKWKAQGEAFGKAPARGTLPGQMPVSGYLGKGLVNSFLKGDGTTGKLTSPRVKVERRYINFLIGGGGHAGKTCMNLLLDGKVVRTATGPNTEPGGSERLDWHTWDVKDLEGKSVVFQVVDDHTGGWGHINIDHIVQSDRKLQAGPARRELKVEKRYLHLPVKTGAVKRRMQLLVDGKVTRDFEVELADEKPSFWAFADVSAWSGKRLTVAVTALPPGSKALEAITQGDELKGEPLYEEKDRPQFHFTSRRGWLNDPNGLVYHKGEYHLYYQHNPYGWDWGNMHWGHAVSKDLLHWVEQPIALYPRKFGDWAFSGSAVVDTDDTAGFKTGKEPALVLAYTSTGRGECIAYSNDRGRTWTEYEGNPVVKHQGRDPRLLWHAPSKRWVMAVYTEADRKQWIAFHTSADLKKWKYESRVEGYFECPDLFELPVEGEKGKSKWVMYAADGQYVLGDFDGRTFTPETKKKLRVWHGNFYAAQTVSGAPDGRRIQVGWASGITFPGMPFNQQMTIPCQLTLRKTGDGLRMFAYPVKEVDRLGNRTHAVKDRVVKPGENALAGIKGELLDVRAEVEVPKGGGFTLTLRGVAVSYDAAKQEVRCGNQAVPLKPADGKVRLRVLLDRGSLELFGNDGLAALSLGARPAKDNKSLEFTSKGGEVKVASLEVYEVRSVWAKR